MSLRASKLHPHAVVVSGLAVLAWTNAALACPVRVAPPGDQRWAAAALDAERRTTAARATPDDCQSIRVTVLESGARLEFTTNDGSHAERQLQGPEELVPAIDALLVTIEPVPPPVQQTSITPNAPKPATEARRHEPSLPAPAANASPHFVLGAAAGSRLTFGHKYFAPAASLQATGVFGHWELGVHGEWDPLFARLAGATPPGFSMSALTVGAVFGRREPAGRFDVEYGLGLGIASVASSADRGTNGAPAPSVDGSQQRVGAYAAAGYPRDKATRVTLSLQSDAALSGLRGAATSTAGLPPFPRYGVCLSVGVEMVAL